MSGSMPYSKQKVAAMVAIRKQLKRLLGLERGTCCTVVVENAIKVAIKLVLSKCCDEEVAGAARGEDVPWLGHEDAADAFAGRLQRGRQARAPVLRERHRWTRAAERYTQVHRGALVGALDSGVASEGLGALQPAFRRKVVAKMGHKLFQAEANEARQRFLESPAKNRWIKEACSPARPSDGKQKDLG